MHLRLINHSRQNLRGLRSVGYRLKLQRCVVNVGHVRILKFSVRMNPWILTTDPPPSPRPQSMLEKNTSHCRQKQPTQLYINSFCDVKGRGYNTQFLLYPRPFDVTEGIFAVLYVSIMGLTRFYKTKVFFTFIWKITERQSDCKRRRGYTDLYFCVTLRNSLCTLLYSSDSNQSTKRWS